ncbi:hypothetical protein FRC18_008294 [Serendipita sp. 400]|nr:hypothetical protein FRC18_008294 [Serendipita sp. 400]
MKVLLALVTLSSSFFASGATATEVVLSAPDAAVSEVNGKCTGKSGAPGVCIATAKCTSAGGEYISNACPGTPADIKCCTKTSCGGGAGNCRWTSQCQSGLTIGHMCPGPSDFMCCLPVGDDTPNFPPPGFPAVNPCKQRSVDGARTIEKFERFSVSEMVARALARAITVVASQST